MRLAVVSPFLDRRHGTELCIVEQIERLAFDYNWDIHLYSQCVEGVKLSVEGSGTPGVSGGGILWHKVSGVPGPHIVQFLWWFAANQLRRWRDRRGTERRPDLIYSPGINCLDADAIVVHIVFHEFYARVRSELRLRKLPLRTWPRSIHRKLYYQLIMALEKRIYSDPRIHLAAVSRHVAEQLQKHFERSDVTVIPNGVDTSRFCPETRLARRDLARESFGFTDVDFVLLLIGNDWKNKGLDSLLQAMTLLRDLPLRLLVVGGDDPGLYTYLLEKSNLQDRVRFLPNSADVLLFYFAADAYVGPSLEDAFGLPILEAMACGLPVIASVRAGASENIGHLQTGLLLKDPGDHLEVAQSIRLLISDASVRHRIGSAASRYVQANCSWDYNASETRSFLDSVLLNLHSH